jgi:tetratricopeptide (TPR) repeat protein
MLRIGFAVVVLIFCCCAGGGEHVEADSLPDFDKMWDYNHPDSTEVKFRALLPRAIDSRDTSYWAQLLTQIARTQGLQMRFDEAHRTLDSVEAMLAGEMVVAKTRYLLERGRVYNSSNKADSARPFFLEGWEVARAGGEDFYAVDAAHMMAIIEPPEEQLAWAEKAMEVAEQSSEERAKRWLGSLYNNTGWTYHDMGDYDTALEMFEKALDWNREHGTDETVRIARWTIARTYRSLGRVEEALAIQEELESEIEEKGLDASGYVSEEIGECLLLLGREDEAKAHFAKAYELLSQDQWLVANQADRLERLKGLSE